MVSVDLDAFEELVDEDLPFRLRRGLPDGLNVQVCQVASDLLEPLGNVD
jgi:hypothetical protein